MTTQELDQKLATRLEEAMANTAKLNAETMKLSAEGALLHKKAQWYEIVLIGGAGITIGIALAKLL